jgi:hypothetical protein
VPHESEVYLSHSVHLNHWIGHIIGKHVNHDDDTVAFYARVTEYLKKKEVSCEVVSVSDSLSHCITLKLTRNTI